MSRIRFQLLRASYLGWRYVLCMAGWHHWRYYAPYRRPYCQVCGKEGEQV